MKNEKRVTNPIICPRKSKKIQPDAQMEKRERDQNTMKNSFRKRRTLGAPEIALH